MTPTDSQAALPFKPSTRPVSEGGRRVLDLLLKTEGLSQAAITRALDLAQPTVTRLLQGFAQDGMTAMVSRQVDRPGHPSVHVTLNPDFAYGLGVSLMGDVVAMTLLDFAGKVRGERRVAMPAMDREKVSKRLRDLKGALIKDAGIDGRRIIGAGVGVSGFYVGDGGKLNTPAYLDEWALVEIAPLLEAALAVPVTVDNDGNVAAVAESLFGVGRRCGDFAYLHLTNGFGGGLISGGKPFRGRYGNAGEFGGIWARLGGSYPSLDLLRQLVADAGGQAFETVEEMIQEIDVKWPGVEAWLDAAEKPFCQLCDVITYTVDPEMIVVGGRLPASIAQALAARIKLPRSDYRRDQPPPTPQILAAEAPHDPVSLGAAAMPLREAFFG